ncbi:hypothetical protein WA171_003792, partial [Blastocystis sp. BT1]
MNELYDEGLEETAIPAWLLSSGSTYGNLSPRERFSKELTILLEWLTLSKKELRLRKLIEEELQNIINASIPNRKLGIVGSSYTGLMLPDSGIDCIVSVSDAKRDTTKIVNALMVSTKFQEIVPTTTDDAIMNIECKHVYSGIAIHLIVAKECNTSFSGFIRYAKRIQGFKDLYICFRYFLKNNRIENDCNHTMVIYLLIIYYIQVTLGGHAEQVALGDMFLGLLDTIPKSSILMPSLSSSRSGLSFFGYLKSVQSKLNIHLDLTSKEAVRVFKRISMLCEDASRTLHRFIDSPSYEGRIASSILHESSRITPAMAQSPFWILVQSSDDSFDEKVGGKKPDDGLRLVLVLLCLLLVTFVFILIILYWRYSITASRSRTPQIILGDYIESREAYVH